MTDSQIILYEGDDGKVKIDVFLQDEDLWLTQKKMAELFDVEVPAISKHLRNIFKSGELSKNSVVSILEITADDGKKYKTKIYRLDTIIAVGYRVNSKRATQFRIWATQTLKEFIIKGFLLDDDRLKNGHHFGKDYFDEVLGRIRDIRSSERRFYQKITDLYSQCSIDYDKDAQITKDFFAEVQNKLHWAIHEHTAAELIAERVDATKENMGLSTWKNAPVGKIRKQDITIAKNYLNEDELKELNLIVSMYLDFAELQAKNRRAMTMADWICKLDDFLRLNEKEILQNKGSISKKLADEKAGQEFEKFKKQEDAKFVSDFDKSVEKFIGGEKES